MDLTKRQKITIASIIITLGLLSTQLVDFNLRFRFLLGLSILAYFLSLWALWEGLNLTKAFILLILPTFFTLSVASFYFLLPVRWLTRLPVAFIFGLSFYTLLLSQNVFNVAAIRTIPLYRAASTTSLLFTVISAFFIYTVISAFHFLFIFNGLVVAAISFPLVLQVIWHLKMEDRVGIADLIQSFVLSLCLGEIALVFSFWPIVSTIWSLVLASSMYILLGLSTHYLRDRLTKRIIWEYLIIGVVVLVVSFLATSWTG